MSEENRVEVSGSFEGVGGSFSQTDEARSSNSELNSEESGEAIAEATCQVYGLKVAYKLPCVSEAVLYELDEIADGNDDDEALTLFFDNFGTHFI